MDQSVIKYNSRVFGTQSSNIGGCTLNVTFTGLSTGEPFEVPLGEIVGVEENLDEGGSFVQNGPGMYYMVKESMIEVMRLVVAAHDQVETSSRGEASE